MATEQTNDQKIKAALADPNILWHGRDLMEWVTQLLEDKERAERIVVELYNPLDLSTHAAAALGAREIIKRLTEAEE